MIHDKLNDSQRQCVEFDGKHLLVLAGAGTGKTLTIVARASYLIQQGVQPHEIQILSFTRKSAQEIRERIKANCLDIPHVDALKGSTFHSWCMDLIRSYPMIFKQIQSFSVIDQDDQFQVFKAICAELKEKGNALRGVDYKEIQQVYSYAVNTRSNLTESIQKIFYSNVDDEDLSDDTVLLDIKKYAEAAIKAYLAYKLNYRYLDYDDILDKVARALHQNPSVRQKITSRYKHILVDETQDTNPLQWYLLDAFRQECSLFCVGDDAQSIYGFRGADFESIHSFKERIPESEVLRLTDNYRSTQELLNLSNWLLQESPYRYDKKLRAFRGKGEMPLIINVKDNWQEANYIAEDIIDNYANRGKDYADHLVLGRSQYAMRTVESLFIQHKIPYQILGGFAFLKAAHIKDVLSALRVVANPRDTLGWMRYLQLWGGVGEVTATNYIRHILELESIKEVLVYLEQYENNDPILLEALKVVHQHLNNPSQAILEAVKKMKPRLESIYADSWEKKRKDDFPLLAVIASTSANIGEFIAEYILDPSLNERLLKGSDDDDVVTISTIHSAKGLEADICYVLNVSPGSYPNKRAIRNGWKEIEEERRCLYVALTRAKNELILLRNEEAVHTASKTVIPPKQQPNELQQLLRNEPVKLSKTKEVVGKVVSVTRENGQIMLSLQLDEGPLTLTNQQFEEKYKLVSMDKRISYLHYILKHEDDKTEDLSSLEVPHYFLDNLPGNLVEQDVPQSRSSDYDDYGGVADIDFDTFDFG